MSEQKRCAYFGCMHPMFVPTTSRQKYCSRECGLKANNRSEAQRERRAKRLAVLAADPKKKKEKYYKDAASHYRSGKNLPDWMYDK